MPFFVQNKMHTISFRIWTLITDPICYDDNYYSKDTNMSNLVIIELTYDSPFPQDANHYTTSICLVWLLVLADIEWSLIEEHTILSLVI